VKTKKQSGTPVAQHSFTALPRFAHYLLTKRFDELIDVQVRTAYELEVPLLQYLQKLSAEEIKEVYKKSNYDTLLLLSQNKIQEHIDDSVNRWMNNQVPFLDKHNVVTQDITLLSLLRKKTFLHFMPDYCRSNEELIELVQEIDLYSSRHESAMFDTFINLFKTKIDEHVHFIETITNTSPGIIYVYDIISNKEVYANKSVTEFLGYTDKELKDLGSDFITTLIHPDDIATITENDSSFNSVKDGEIRSVKYRIKNKQGEYRWMRAYETPFRRDREGNIIEKIGIAIDVHEQKKTADDLKQREQELLLTQEQYKQKPSHTLAAIAGT
jgi:PAS domain S-box-containing protein